VKIAIITFGCKVNQYESEYMAEVLEENGHIIVPEESQADVYIINSCAVTHTAENKVKNRIRRIKRAYPSSKVMVVGCYPQLSPEEVLKVGADVVLGNKEKKEIWKYISLEKPSFFVDRAYWLRDGKVEKLKAGYIEKTRAFVKVEDGCDRSCTYCAIRLARGTKIRSKPIEQSVEEIEGLVKMGFKEIVITGINLGRYGIDTGYHLTDLLWEIEKIEGDFRIRLSSLNPEDVDEKIYNYFRNSSKVCHHLHLSLQSGSNRILKKMNRSYTKEEFMNIVESLRKIDPYFSITTDVIVGFPGETERDFLESVEAIKEAKFSRVHAFRYSKRAGTLAAIMKDQIPGNVKRDRINYLENVAKEVAKEYRKNLVGKRAKVLVENKRNGFYRGYDQYYIYHEMPSGKTGEIRETKIVHVTDEGVVSVEARD